jgi:predicted O-linked N-acetylglucosamine transferase (SPINDLY family)
MSELLQRALVAHRAGRLDEADAAYVEALALAPDEPVGLHMLGLLRHQQGRHVEAASLIARAILRGAAGAAPLANLAAVELARGDSAAAATAATRALALDSEHFGAAYNLGLAASAQGRWVDSRNALRIAHRIRPDDAKAASALARACEACGDTDAALILWRELAAAHPDDASVGFALGSALYRQARLTEAIAVLREDVRRPDAPRDASLLLAAASLDLGEVGESEAEYDRLLAAHPDYHQAASNRLVALQHDPTVSPRRLLDEHRLWAMRHAPAAEPLPPEDPDPGRALRLGFLSPRLHEGPVATFLTPLLQALDAGRYGSVLYSASGYRDAASDRLRSLAGAWRDVEHLDDEALHAQVRADGIDVLLDLSGHAPGNRLRALARRVAPVQVSWLDYFCTTGIPAIDAFFSDAALTPEGHAPPFTERVLRLAHGRLCYLPPVAPDISPRIDAKPLRFGGFNRLAKLDADVGARWSVILRAVPGSLLRLRANGLGHTAVREWVYTHRFASHGITRERIEFEDFGDHASTLRSWSDVDIALDPYPFSGCATTCDALWMGVPVVTRAGATLVSRQSAALLTRVGLDDLVAPDWEAYVGLAVALARNAQRRLELRAQLRERVRDGLADKAAFGRAFEAAVRQLWREACTRGLRAEG